MGASLGPSPTPALPSRSLVRSKLDTSPLFIAIDLSDSIYSFKHDALVGSASFKNVPGLGRLDHPRQSENESRLLREGERD